MLAFHGKQEIKDKYIARVKAHYDADEIIKGKYWENGRGCAVGCTLHSSNHSDYEKELGIPRIIARLEDGIFEGLPNERAKEFPLEFLTAVSVGADLSMVFPKFMHWLLVDGENGVIRHARTDKTKLSIRLVADLYQRKIDGENIDINEWLSARTNAYAYAYAYAAYAADADADAAAAADAAAYAYAYAYAYAAADAAAAAADADAAADAAADADADAAADAARQKARTAQANKLIELLLEAK